MWDSLDSLIIYENISYHQRNYFFHKKINLNEGNYGDVTYYMGEGGT